MIFLELIYFIIWFSFLKRKKSSKKRCWVLVPSLEAEGKGGGPQGHWSRPQRELAQTKQPKLHQSGAHTRLAALVFGWGRGRAQQLFADGVYFTALSDKRRNSTNLVQFY